MAKHKKKLNKHRSVVALGMILSRKAVPMRDKRERRAKEKKDKETVDGLNERD